jgi:hypothetical protein
MLIFFPIFEACILHIDYFFIAMQIMCDFLQKDKYISIAHPLDKKHFDVLTNINGGGANSYMSII